MQAINISILQNGTTCPPPADVWEYLISIRGNRRTETELLAPISIIYLTIFTFGFFGNFILLWLILVNKSFHTPINYYLVNLSVSDLLILALGLPHDLYMMWNRYPYPFEEVTCRLRALLAEASMISSVLTITALTIERYIAVVHPLSSAMQGALRRNLPVTTSKTATRMKQTDFFGCCRDWGRFKKVRIILLVMWMLAPLFSLPITLQVTLSYVYRNDSATNYQSVRIEESSICTVSGEGEYWYAYPVLASFILFFLLPLVLITILYVLILRGVRQSTRFINLSQRGQPPAPTAPTNGLQGPKDSVRFRRGMSAILRSTDMRRDDRQQGDRLRQSQHQARLRTNKTLIRILVFIVIAFFTCFAPFHAERLLVVLMPAKLWENNSALWMIHDVLYHISGICLFANSVCNPILYNIVSRRIRAEFQAALICGGRRGSSRRRRFLGKGRDPYGRTINYSLNNQNSVRLQRVSEARHANTTAP